MIRSVCFFSLVLMLHWAGAQPVEGAFFTGVAKYKIQFKGNDEIASFIEANEPNDQLTLMVGEGDYIVKLDGGEYPKTFMFIADSNREYSIDMAGQRAFRHSAHSDLIRDTNQVEPVAKPTGRSKPVGEYTCQEYRLQTDDAVFFYYVTDEFRVNLDAFPEEPRSKAMFLAKGLEGRLPLRTVKRTKQLAVETSLESIQPRVFQEGAFSIPDHFTVKGRDVRY